MARKTSAYQVRLADKTMKELHKCFEQFGLKFTAEANLDEVNFLDVTFDFKNGTYNLYSKPNVTIHYTYTNIPITMHQA